MTPIINEITHPPTSQLGKAPTRNQTTTWSRLNKAFSFLISLASPVKSNKHPILSPCKSVEHILTHVTSQVHVCAFKNRAQLRMKSCKVYAWQTVASHLNTIASLSSTLQFFIDSCLHHGFVDTFSWLSLFLFGHFVSISDFRDQVLATNVCSRVRAHALASPSLSLILTSVIAKSFL